MNQYRKIRLWLMLTGGIVLCAAGIFYLLLTTALFNGFRDAMEGIYQNSTDPDNITAGYGILALGILGALGFLGELLLWILGILHLCFGGLSLLFGMISNICAKRSRCILTRVMTILSALPVTIAGVFYAMNAVGEAFSVPGILLAALLLGAGLGSTVLAFLEKSP